jgi:hypothetical protein
MLTNEDKKKLKLYIPKSLINDRMTLQDQKIYCRTISKDLYLNQSVNFKKYFRILQKYDLLTQNARSLSLDNYVNIIYKDIYARYIMSKGLGVEWKGFYSNYGVVNPVEKDSFDRNFIINEACSMVIDFINNNHRKINFENSIGVYSAIDKKFIGTESVKVENVKKIG